ncbi:hypothetical protein G9G63_09240 [Paenibacillus sp. EKM202P]|uniref:hypothetical protein n=1 Tax=Paenibacillus TaxID=44249 RepID=UPI0013EB6B88|nr:MULTISPECIES: hypothetical protein [unclassified Paenibacillus]KAF6565334.1 hypothetical protein G9G63_09240 [Paenibacillus sp. EKM202P]KAF6569340.1 hypothetical protein G9G64_12850 [Paenibacillus sp. EKM207P]
MKINKKYKYWELYYDINGDTSSTFENRQCIGSIWSDEWSGLELFDMTDEQLKEHLTDDIEYYHEKVDKRKIKSAIRELREIHKEVKVMC